MSGIAFESLETHLNTLISRGFLANWFRTIFCIFICSLPDIHLFLISCNLFVLPTSTRLLIISTRFHLFTSYFYYFLLVCHLPLVYKSFLLVSTHLPDFSTRLPVASYLSAYTRAISNFQQKKPIIEKSHSSLSSTSRKIRKLQKCQIDLDK